MATDFNVNEPPSVYQHRMKRFNENDTKTLGDIEEKINTAMSARYGRRLTYIFDNVMREPDGTYRAVFHRSIGILEMQGSVIGLPPGFSDGAKVAARYESMPEHKERNLFMTEFEPLHGYAKMARLTEGEHHVRGVMARVFGVAKEPWKIKVAEYEGGYLVQYPSKAYSAAVHEKKINEAIKDESLGGPGWYYTVDARRSEMRIIPATPATFEPAYEYPYDREQKLWSAKNREWMHIPIGKILPPNGDVPAETLSINFDATPHGQIGGIIGGGKSVLINTIAAGIIDSGIEMYVINTPDKSSDFMWMKPFCAQGGWGCDSLEAALTTAKLAVERAQRNSRILKANGVTQWKELRGDASFAPFMVLVDEYSDLQAREAKPPGSKDDPDVIAFNRRAKLRYDLGEAIARLVRVYRAAGACVWVSTQVANATTGMPPALRELLGHKILMGARPTKGAMDQIFPDATRIPRSPEHLLADAAASRGLGYADLQGTGAAIIKPYYAPVTGHGNYRDWLVSRGAIERSDEWVTPTIEDIERIAGHVEEDEDGAAIRLPETPQRNYDMSRENTVYDENGKPLRGAALAAAQSKKLGNF